MALEQSKQVNIEKQPVPAGSVDNAEKIETKKNLEILLGDKNLAPETAEAIRKQIQAIESGEAPVVTEEIANSSSVINKTLELPTTNISPDILAAALNNNIDLIKASEAGAGYEAMQMLIEEAKRKANQNKN